MPDASVTQEDPWAPVLPRAVREQVERANQLAREAGIANVPPASDGPGGDDAGADVALAEPSPPSPLDIPGASPAPLPGEVEPRAPAQPSQAEWEQRYQTLQGKYNAEMPELRGQIRALQDLVAQVQARAAPAPMAPEQAPAAAPRYINPPPVREIPPEDIDAYGRELVDASQRWAEARFAPLLQDWERRILSIEGAHAQLAQQAATQGIDAQLDRLVPGWQALNNDETFKTWLRQVERFSGRTFSDLANEAYGMGDAARVANFFQTFQREHTQAEPAVGTQPRQTAPGAMTGASAAPLPLADLAVPGRAPVASVQLPGAPERRLWRQAEIKRFYDDRARGMWRGREADAEAIEQDIFAAGREGRIRP
jgi:hypothetical protein